MNFEGRLYQIAVVVRSLETGMESYSKLLGLGPWSRIDTDYNALYRGRKVHVANRNAFARWGDLYLEMIEPGIGETNAMEWLRDRGEGIFHLGYATDNLDQRPDGAQACFETLDNRTPEDRPAIVHLDTVERLGYYVELADSRLVEKLCRWIDSDGQSGLADG